MCALGMGVAHVCACANIPQGSGRKSGRKKKRGRDKDLEKERLEDGGRGRREGRKGAGRKNPVVFVACCRLARDLLRLILEPEHPLFGAKVAGHRQQDNGL